MLRQNLIRKDQHKFQRKIDEKPEFVCLCCHRVLYRGSMEIFTQDKYDMTNHTVQKALDQEIVPEKQQFICQTCHRDLRKQYPRMPSQAVANGLKLDHIPEELQDLNDLERRFISLRIPFMKMIALPKGGQYGINGPCVNVPSTTDAVCNLLPRMPSEAQLVDFKLKRKLQYKGHHMSSKVRPEKIWNALQFLKEHNPLYSNININENWEEACEQSDLWQFIAGRKTTEEEQVDSEMMETQPDQDNSASLNHLDQHLEEADQAVADGYAEVTLQPFSSCLQKEDVEAATFCLAPGEGQKPKHIIMDESFEQLSFPDLFPFGKGAFSSQKDRSRKLNLRRYYNQWLLNLDGRFAANIEYLLAVQYATELKQV